MDTTALVEALLAPSLHLSPEVVADDLYYIANPTGRMSLYRKPLGGGPATRLLPEDLALPSPKILGAQPFAVVPKLGRIVLTIDDHGDENYQPFSISIDGGTPEPLWGDRFAGNQVFTVVDGPEQKAVLVVSPRTSPVYESYLADLATLQLTSLGESSYGNFPVGRDETFGRFALIDRYTAGDNVLYLWEEGERRLLSGVPIEDRDAEVRPSGFGDAHVRDDGVLLITTLFADGGGLCRVGLDGSGPVEVAIDGTIHDGTGELTDFAHVDGDRYHVRYNIDGCSFGYEGDFDPAADRLVLDRTLWGSGELANGVVQAAHREEGSGRWALAFSTATSPVQLYTIEHDGIHRQTDESIEGIDEEALASGEDASFTSHDGLRISARLYLPAEQGDEAHPVIYYVHGGPQSQERPDFTWFSMPLIQLFTLHGFAVFVPNARGSSGYGQSYMKLVDRDWGGADRLDHVAGVEQLKADPRLDAGRIGVMGRSYGGFMTLTLLGRHPDLWAAGVDMFGPYDLFTFLDALPETWKTYMYMAIGHPERDEALLRERSPRSHLNALSAPLLVIQGRNDPRVVVEESDRLVAELRSHGKEIEYLVFDDEGHDMVKHPNKVRAYVAIVEFFAQHLR